MKVEECTQAVLAHMLPLDDPWQVGTCIDIGVGTFAFYCEIFARLGFKTIAVEPIPNQNLRAICQQYRIELIEACVSDTNDIQTLYIGSYNGSRNPDVSSLQSDWWGASVETKQVKSLTLGSLLTGTKAEQVTCMKIDVEGMEPIIIEQFLELPDHLLPTIIVFEYGGGSTKQEGLGGWSPKYFEGTLRCLEILKHCRYQLAIKIDSSLEAVDTYYDLTQVEPSQGHLFAPFDIYGNFIVCRKTMPYIEKIQSICSGYLDNVTPPRIETQTLKSKLISSFRKRLGR